MEYLSIRQIQMASLQLLKTIDAICKEHKIKYYLMYGTLIGAVRHHGFIPWDDDLDIAVRREDYKKLISAISLSEIGWLSVCTRINTANYTYGIARVSDNRYKYVDSNKTNKPVDMGVFIDLYPIDNFCNSTEEAKRLKRRTTIQNRLFDIYVNRIIHNGFAMYCLDTIAWSILHFVKGNKWNERIDREIVSIIERNTAYSDKYVGIPCWTDYGLQFPKKAFDKQLFVEFEDFVAPIPSGYDEILRSIYGDYMKLPPEHERNKRRHNYEICKRDNY